MAQQPVLKRAQQANGVEIGRPAGSRNAKPKVKKWDYSRPKQTIQKFEEFLDYLAGYPDKTGLMGYVYRLRPRIDLSLIGIQETSIIQTHVMDDLTEEKIGEMFGRGHYMVKLHDGNRPRGQQECCRTWIELDQHEKPPQYDPLTLCLAEPKNADEINRQINAGVFVREHGGLVRLRTEADGAPPKREPAAPVVAPPPPAPAGVDLIGGREVVGQIVLAALQRGNTSIQDTIAMARELRGKDIDVAELVRQVAAELKPNGSGVDPAEAFLSNLQKWSGVIDKIRGAPVAAAAGETVAPAAGGGADAWAPHLAGIFTQGRAFLAEAVAAYRTLRTENGNGHPPANGVQPMPPQANRPLSLHEATEEVLMLGYAKMTEGVTGFDFAAYVCNHHPGGLEVYKALDSAGGTVGTLALCAMNPSARNLVNGPERPKLEAFLNDFFSYDTGEDTEPPSGGAGKAVASS